MFLEKAPEGTLRIAHNHNTVQYYWKNQNSGSGGTYIKRSDIEIARQLAQKDYATRLIKIAEQKRRALDQCLKNYNGKEMEEFYENFSEDRKVLIKPYILSEKAYAELWIEEAKKSECGVKQYPINEENGIMTDKGELVRSKSEKILADKLYKMNIPYIYEKPLYLKNSQLIYPDFTVLNRFTRQEFYWEHFGMLDKPEYCESAVKKIAKYSSNQIYQGRKLLVTYETSTQFLKMSEVDGIINEFLLSTGDFV